MSLLDEREAFVHVAAFVRNITTVVICKIGVVMTGGVYGAASVSKTIELARFWWQRSVPPWAYLPFAVARGPSSVSC